MILAVFGFLNKSHKIFSSMTAKSQDESYYDYIVGRAVKVINYKCANGAKLTAQYVHVNNDYVAIN